MEAPLVTIFVRHSADCKYAGDEFCKRCSCRKHLRWAQNGKQYRRKTGSRWLVKGIRKTGDGRVADLELKGLSGQSLMVYKLQKCPHAKDMLVAYVPSAKLLVEADLFVELAGYSPASAAFAEWLTSGSSPRVDWIAGTHLGKVSRAAFEEAGQTLSH